MPVLNGCFAFGALLSSALICGVQLERSGNVDFTCWPYYLAAGFLALGITPVLGWCMRQLNCLKDNPPVNEKGRHALSPGKYFLAVFCFLELSYLVTLLAVWPGFFSYDAHATVHMVFTNQYSTLCPRLHVLLLGGCLKFVNHYTHSYNMGIAVYLMIQMAVLSAIFAYMMTYLYTIKTRPLIRRIGLLFLAFFPTVSMFVCCTTKDSMCAGGVALLTTLLYQQSHEPENFWRSNRKKLLFVLAWLLICFFRNNGIYACIPFLIVFTICHRKHWRKCLCLICGILVVFVLGNYAMDKAFSFRKGPIAEMFSVPMQQLARVYTEKKPELAKEDTDVLYDLIPESILEKYTPKLADSVKVNFLGDNFKKEPWRYISVWLKLGLKYPDIYMNAFLENTYGYWYPDTIVDGYRGIDITERKYEDSSYFQYVTEPPGERHSMIPWLERFYERVSLEIYQQKVPVVAMLFSIGFWHWVYLFLAFYLMLYGRKKQIMVLLPTAFLYLTVLLGPIVLVRYVIYIFFCVPIALALLFEKNNCAQAA